MGKLIQDMTIKEIEDKLAAARIRFYSKEVIAEDENGNYKEAYLYKGKILYDRDGKKLVGFTVKRNWKWLFVSMVFASIALITVIATQ